MNFFKKIWLGYKSGSDNASKVVPITNTWETSFVNPNAEEIAKLQAKVDYQQELLDIYNKENDLPGIRNTSEHIADLTNQINNLNQSKP